jgi:segregation and condensation protein A
VSHEPTEIDAVVAAEQSSDDDGAATEASSVAATDAADVVAADAHATDRMDAASLSTLTDAAASAQISVAGAPEIMADQSGEELKLVLGEFSGPLDLLLYLIRQEQVSIYDIPVARITDEYLRYLRLMQGMDIAVASDFLVMAATLIEIKSRTLLPSDPTLAEGEEAADDPRRELIDQLLEHQKFKAAAEMLWSRATVEQAVFTRAPIESDENNPEVSAGVFDLLKMFQEILARRKEEVRLEIERDEMTMADMLERLRNMIRSAGELNLRQFFEQARSRRELVLAFLSVLEIVRTTEIVLIQQQTFGDIIARVSNGS